MKLFTAVEGYSSGEPLTYTLEDLDNIEMNLNNEQRVLDSAVESYMDASTALKHLVKLEGLAPHNRGVYDVTMESINDQLGYPEGTVLSSEGIGSSIKNFAKKVWAKIVAAYRAVRDWIRKLFGMAPIPSEGDLKKTDDIIKEAADEGPTIKTDDSKFTSASLNPIAEEMRKAMVDVDHELEAAVKYRDDRMAALMEKQCDQHEYEVEVRAIKQEYQDTTVALVNKSKELAEEVKVNLQETYDNHEKQAHYMEMSRWMVSNTTHAYEESEQSLHPKAYDIEMGIALSTVLKAAKLSTIWVTSDTAMSVRYATKEIKEIMPFLNDPTNTVMTEHKDIRTFDGVFMCGPYGSKKATIHRVTAILGGHYDFSYIETGESHDQIVANHVWFKTVTDNINSIMEKLTPDHFYDSEDGVKLAGNLSADLESVGRRKIELMKNMDRNNKLVKALMEDTNEATYRYLQDHYIASDTDNRNIKG